MGRIINSIAECQDETHTLRPSAAHVGEVIHRFYLEGCECAADIAAFERTLEVLGHRMAYQLVVWPDGRIEQSLCLDALGWHAKGWSRTHLGVAVFGDFRRHEPTHAQRESLVWLLAGLSRVKGSINFAGHDQMPGSSSDPDKICPGKYLDIGDLHHSVSWALQDSGWRELEGEGLIRESAQMGVR